MVNRIKVCRNVPFDDPEIPRTFTKEVAESPDGVHRTAIGSESIRELTKVRLVDRFQDHSHRLLYNPVTKGRDAQRAFLAIRFGDVHPSHGIGFKVIRPEGFVQLEE